jgi:hypothetical protein
VDQLFGTSNTEENLRIDALGSNVYGLIVAINSSAQRPELLQHIPGSFLNEALENDFWAASLISLGSKPK